MEDLIPCKAAQSNFQRWLESGNGPMTVYVGERVDTLLIRLEKALSVDYLYRTSIAKDGGISWNNSLLFCGVYDGENHALYLARNAQTIFTRGPVPLVTEPGDSMLEDICGKINRRVEDILANDKRQFLENDALLAEYQALIQDTGSPIHRMKAITDALNSSNAKMVTVTVQKGEGELTFKMEASQMKGHHAYYSSYYIPAADRRRFQQVFGRSADFKAEDVIRITYGRNTIYLAEPAQAESTAKDGGEIE